MLYAFFQPAFLYRIIARLALHPCRVTHMPYRPVKELRRAIDDPEQATLSPQEYLVSSTHSMQQHLMILCNTSRTSSSTCSGQVLYLTLQQRNKTTKNSD